jgi:hypothetical protein
MMLHWMRFMDQILTMLRRKRRKRNLQLPVLKKRNQTSDTDYQTILIRLPDNI